MLTHRLISEEGFLASAWQLNNESTPAKIYPYLVKKKGASERTFDVSLTGKSNDYRGIAPEEFMRKLVAGAFPEAATVRMKERGKRGVPGSGWLIRNLRIDETLKEVVRGGFAIRESLRSVAETFETEVREASRASPESLEKIKAKYPRIPEKIVVETTVFRRNPVVVVEVLQRADGTCEGCASLAPFNRRSDGTPYLEVHHKVMLADGGEDTTENSVALCPNCHRQRHYG